MGLLQKMSDNGITPKKTVIAVEDKVPVQKKSNSVGLLKKSMILSNDDGLDFFEFLKGHDIKICSLLKQNSDANYIASKAIGLDAHSICMSVSTNDFWQGIIKQQDHIYSYSQNDSAILPFYQFFSKKIKDQIKFLNIVQRSSSGEILIFCTNELLTNSSIIINEIKKLKTADEIPFAKSENETSGSSYTLDFSEAIQSFILANYKSPYQKTFEQTIEQAISFELLKNFPAPDKVIKLGSARYKIVYSSDQKIPLEVFSNHLRFNSSFFLDEHSQLLSVEYNEN